jgi:hypothetical protein
MEDFNDHVITLKGLGILFVHMSTLEKDVKRIFAGVSFTRQRQCLG